MTTLQFRTDKHIFVKKAHIVKCYSENMFLSINIHKGVREILRHTWESDTQLKRTR